MTLLNLVFEMSWTEKFSSLGPTRWAYLALLVCSTFQGAHCQLMVSPVGPWLVDSLSGTNVTLPVSFSGAPDPVVTWFKGNLTVGSWTINSSENPDIDENSRDVLRIHQNGSLSFLNVPLSYDGNYAIELTKSGLERAITTFTLRIFETFQNVTLSLKPEFAIEGTDQVTLQYSMLQGVAEHQMWFFNGEEIRNSSYYLVLEQKLTILSPNRSHTGMYTVSLRNPFSSVTVRAHVAVFYGPDEPVLEAHPAQVEYVSGDSVNLSCSAEGLPLPTVQWSFGERVVLDAPEGVLSLTNLSTSQGGVYICTVLNEQTRHTRQKNMTLKVYKKPLGSPVCSLDSPHDGELQYRCEWLGGTPQTQLSFPALSQRIEAEMLSISLNSSDTLNGETITCVAKHPLIQNTCNVTASNPRRFLPSLRTTVSSDGKIVVTIGCYSEAVPEAVVSWSIDGEAVAEDLMYQISRDTTQLTVRHYNISRILLHSYSCIARNPLGSRRRDVQLQGPFISASSLFPNPDGTIITLTWEVPDMSVVTGFDIQMKGPELSERDDTARSNPYRTIQQKPGTSRSADVYVLDPKSTYRFRIVPKARLTAGEPSEVHRIGPGEGLSGPAIAGIAAGIPCSLLVLLLLGGLIFLCIHLNKKRSHQTRYPVSRVNEAKTTQPEKSPHHLLTGGVKSLPDYNKLHQAPSERSMDLPSFSPLPPPVRVATVV